MKTYTYNKQLIEKYRLNLMRNATKAEKLFKRKLSEHGIKHISQKPFFEKNVFCFADFFLPDYNIIVEIDGGYHNNFNQKCIDDFKDVYYKQQNFKVLRITNEQVQDIDIIGAINNC